jgi:3-dehydroquinate synthase
MSIAKVISLIGFSGTGKSTVATLLAERLGWSCFDLDDDVERVAGRTIPDIFAEEGEAAFRSLEAQALLSRLAAGSEDGLVIALGGGATLTDSVRRAIAEAGIVVCLEATAATIDARLGAGGGKTPSERPLLAGPNPLTQIERLKGARTSLYGLADFTVHVDALTPDEVADEVVRLYSAYGERAFGREGRIEALSARPALFPEIVDGPGAATIVRTASADYPVYVGWGALEALGEHVKRASGARRAFVISDSTVLEQWGETALSSLRTAGLEAASAAVPPGDDTKSLASTGRLYGWLAEQRAERRDVIVALGGGMAGDLAGFVAATYLRGMPVVQAPTSLLGMVDASIGGKTAVNHAGAKNIVGAFYQPRAVVADVATLTTLPRRELIEGLGEVIKHAFILDESLLELLEQRLEDLLALEPQLTTEVITRNMQLKAGVVSEDERETGGRREILNYGHTLGHAFEAAGEYKELLHGEAVAVGMMAAGQIGVRMGVTPSEVIERQKALIERSGLPLHPPSGLSRDRIAAAMAMDKKIISGTQRWILLEGIGRTVVRDDVPPALVSDVLDELLA